MSSMASNDSMLSETRGSKAPFKPAIRELPSYILYFMEVRAPWSLFFSPRFSLSRAPPMFAWDSSF